MKMPEVRIWEAVAFLRKYEVLKVEKEKITLMNFYKFENDIAECLQHLIQKKPWMIDLDVRKVLCSAERERMRDQLGNNLCASDSGMNGEDDKSDLNSESEEETVDTSITLDPDQVRAAEMMCANAVTVISGKGGCGKTTVVSMIFKAAQKKQEKDREDNCSASEEAEQNEPIEVLLTAPTGRAASLLTKKTCFTAYTMHQVCVSFTECQLGH